MTKEIYKWIATFVVLVVIAVVLPSQLSFVITATLFGVFAMSWVFFTTFSGYLNLGHVIFIGVAGYTSGILNYHFEWPMWLCMICGVVVGTGVGWLYLNPIHKRISGLSFEMVSFLSIIALSNLLVSSYARPVTGGDIGLSPIDGLFSELWLALVLAGFLCGVGVFFAWYLRSGSGRIIDFAREDQSIVRQAGADPHKYTGRLLLLSGVVGAIGGVVYVHYSGAAVVSNTVALAFMIRIIVMAIIGGRFSLRGAILGAYLVVFLSMELMQYVDAYVQWLIIYGIGFIIYFLVPKGLAGVGETLWVWVRGLVRGGKKQPQDESVGA